MKSPSNYGTRSNWKYAGHLTYRDVYRTKILKIGGKTEANELQTILRINIKFRS